MKPRKQPTTAIATTRASDVTKRALGVIKWPFIGALIAGGALVIARAFGPKVVRNLGYTGGEAFAEGMARMQAELASLRQSLPSISGERGTYGARRSDADVLADNLSRMPGYVGSGVVLQNPTAPNDQWISAFEVQWLRGYPAPSLPPAVDGYPVKLEIVDTTPAAYENSNERGRYARRG